MMGWFVSLDAGAIAVVTDIRRQSADAARHAAAKQFVDVLV